MKALISGSGLFLVISFIITGLISAGHTYTSWIRVLFDSQSRKEKQVYVHVFLGLISLLFLWSALKIPYLLSFAFYMNLYHLLRQYYGVLVWYQRLNRRRDRYFGFIIHGLLFIPVLGYHFRSVSFRGSYLGEEILIHPDPRVFYGLIATNLVLVLIWFAYEIRLWSQSIRERNRLWVAIGIVSLWNYCLLLGRDFKDILFPLLVSHGVAYYFLVGRSLQKTASNQLRELNRVLVLVGGCGLCFGTLEYLFRQRVVNLDYLNVDSPVYSSWVLALFLGPGLFHNLVDGWIWSGKNPGAKKIYES
jgi:hypothetical protein